MLQDSFIENITPAHSLLVQDNINVDDNFQCLSHFFRVVSNAYDMESYSVATTKMLDVALRRFKTDVAMVLHPVSDSVCEVLGFAGESENLYIGKHINYRKDLCGKILNENETWVQSGSELFGGQIETMAYNHFNVGTYLGASVNSSFLGQCVLCFISSKPSEPSYSAYDIELLELLAEGIACMVDLQKSQAQRKTIDLAAFADGSVKTLDEYLEQARLPEMLGVPARVLEVLQNRIGQEALGISYIAEELNLSKRTLQRRLQQQDVNFAELRDQVRFHHSIDYLIKQHMSIDSISSALDFSDRTSFTNAFKRWTGLSPSTFRKLFRDYV